MVAATIYNDITILGMAWQDHSCHTLISSCGTSLAGNDARKRRWDATGRPYVKSVKRPQLFEDYHDGSGAVDAHNHAYQGGTRPRNPGTRKTGKTESLDPSLV